MVPKPIGEALTQVTIVTIRLKAYENVKTSLETCGMWLIENEEHLSSSLSDG